MIRFKIWFYFVCWFIAARAIFQLSGPVTITGDRAANFGLCSALRTFEQGGIFIVPHRLRHGTSVYAVSSERPAPTFHSGIRTPDARITRSSRPTLWPLRHAGHFEIRNKCIFKKQINCVCRKLCIWQSKHVCVSVTYEVHSTVMTYIPCLAISQCVHLAIGLNYLDWTILKD
jgi:hypothetical protein